MKFIFSIILFTLSTIASAQDSLVITANFSKFPNSTYELKGVNGLKRTTISKAKSGEDGKFKLSFPKEYKGEAQLFMNDTYLTLFLLNKENIDIQWDDLTKVENIKLTGSTEYDVFIKGMKIFQDSEARLADLHYLLPLYEKDTIKHSWLATEMLFVANSFPVYVKSLNDTLIKFLYINGIIMRFVSR